MDDGMKTKTGRTVKIILVLSLMLNLLVVGAFVGAWAGSKGDRPPKAQNINFGPYTQALTQADRRALRGALLQEQRNQKFGRRAMQASFVNVLSVLRQDPFDPAAFEAVIREQQQITFERQTLGTNVLISRVMDMTDAERAQFADNLEQALRAPKKGGGRK